MVRDELNNDPNHQTHEDPRELIEGPAVKSQKEPNKLKNDVNNKQDVRLVNDAKTFRSKIGWCFLALIGPSLLAFLILQNTYTDEKEQVSLISYHEIRTGSCTVVRFFWVTIYIDYLG